MASLPPIQLSKPQSRIYASKARFRVVVAGRRSGKTFLAQIEALTAAKVPGTLVWIIGPTLKQTRFVHWLQFKARVPRQWVRQIRESDLELHLVNGSVIGLRGADADPDQLRGQALDLLVAEEFSAWERVDEAWELALRPSLADRRGRALFLGTPAGFNRLYDFYLRGLDAERPDWASFQFTTLEGGQVPAEEVEEARRDMTLAAWKQEFLATFESMGDRVYPYFEPETHICEVADDPESELLVGADFNIGAGSVVLANAKGEDCYIFDELVARDTRQLAQQLTERFPAPRKIHAYPDPSGRRRQTAAGGWTDFSILENAGIATHGPRKAPAIADRVNNTNAALRSADDAMHLYVHPRCTRLITSLRGQTYVDGAPAKGDLDGPVDALGYLLWGRFRRFGGKTTITRFAI